MKNHREVVFHKGTGLFIVPESSHQLLSLLNTKVYKSQSTVDHASRFLLF